MSIIDELSRGEPAAVLAQTPLGPHRFTVAQYHEMIAAGILTRNDRVQLLEGVIAEMTPIGVPHFYSVQAMMRELLNILPKGWEICVQQPVTLSTSEPEPDLMVIRGSYRDYRDHHPSPRDVGLIVEIADSSVTLDRITKARIYAAAGVPEYWIVNLVDRQVEVYRQPQSSEAAYSQAEVVAADGRLPLTLDGRACGEIPVAAILP